MPDTPARQSARAGDQVMAETMRVRLYWQNGRVEELKGEIDVGTTHIVRPSASGNRHFTTTEETDDEGFAIFWEDEEPHAH